MTPPRPTPAQRRYLEDLRHQSCGYARYDVWRRCFERGWVKLDDNAALLVISNNIFGFRLTPAGRRAIGLPE